MHFNAQNRVIWRIKRKDRSNGLACRRVQEPKKCSKFRTKGVYILPIWEQKPLGRLRSIFLLVGFYDVITPFKFGDDRFRSFGWLRIKVCLFQYTLKVVLTILTLSCEVWYNAWKIMGSRLWPFGGHVTSSVTWPFDSAYVVSYWWSIVTMRLSCTIREI